MDTDEKRGTAHHEAGHAVVAHHFKVPIISIKIAYNEADGHWRGETTPQQNGERDLDRDERGAIRAAGRAAEELFDCYGWDCGAARDIEAVWNMIPWRFEDDDEALLKQREEFWDACKLAAGLVLQENDRLVRIIAERLIETGHISGDEFKRMMTAG